MPFASETKYLLDFTTRDFVDVSGEVKNLLGYSGSELIEREYDGLIIETSIIKSNNKTLKSFAELMQERIKGNSDIFICEYLLAKANGEYVWVRDSNYVIKQGSISLQKGVLQDISEVVNLRKLTNEIHDELSSEDRLTKLPNRQKLFDNLNNEIKRANRSGAPLSFLLVDMSNYFKFKKDKGDEQLDKALLHVSRILKHATRDIDFVGRITESEFGIIMPYTLMDNAVYLIKRLNKLLTKKNIRSLSDEFDRDYNFNFGVSTCVIGSSNATSMYKSALVDMQMNERSFVGTDEQNILRFPTDPKNITIH